MSRSEATTDVDAVPAPLREEVDALDEITEESLVQPEDPVVAKAKQTDNALRAWRSETVKRRARYDRQATVEEVRFAKQRRAAMFFGGAACSALGIALASGTVAWTLMQPEAQPAPQPTEPQPAVVQAALDARAEVPVAPEAPVAAEVPVMPVAQPDVEAAPVPQPVVDAAIPVVSTRQWVADNHFWIAAKLDHAEPSWLQWRDASGKLALDPMSCKPIDGARDCTAGRSDWRLAQAVRDGAAAGTWTIEACSATGCAQVGTLEVPAP